MSRVTYTDMTATGGQEALRTAHGVRLVNEREEGSGLNTLPNGVFGFTYSPALPNAPLFAVPRYRSYEIHKVEADAYIVGFGTAEDAEKMASQAGELTVRIQPQPEDGCNTLLVIPYSRIRQHRQYAAPNQHGFTVSVVPAVSSVG